MAGVCVAATLGTPILVHPKAGNVRGPPSRVAYGRGHTPGLSGASFLSAWVGRGRRASLAPRRSLGPAGCRSLGRVGGPVRRRATVKPGSGFQNPLPSPPRPRCALRLKGETAYPEAVRRALLLATLPSWGHSGFGA